MKKLLFTMITILGVLTLKAQEGLSDEQKLKLEEFRKTYGDENGFLPEHTDVANYMKEKHPELANLPSIPPKEIEDVKKCLEEHGITLTEDQQSKKHCEHQGWVTTNQSTSPGCWGIHTFCVHSFLFWEWETQSDCVVGGNCTGPTYGNMNQCK